MSPISAIRYPSWGDLGHSAAQRLAGSIDCKRAQTSCSRLNHFLGFVENYKLGDKYLTSNAEVTDEIMLRYVTFLLSGFTILCIKILVGTIKGYMAAVNKHYRDNKFREPFDAKDDSDAAVLLRAQEKFEDAPAKRAPLTNQMIVKMCELAKQDPLGFHACVWDFVAIGRFGGFRQQEYAMDSKTEIKYYVKPDGTCVVRAFTVKNFIFYNTGDVILEKPLRNRVGVNKLGTQYDVQKNRMNGQIVCVVRLLDYPDYDPVDCGLNIVARASHLGFTDPDDPLCVCTRRATRCTILLVKISRHISDS